MLAATLAEAGAVAALISASDPPGGIDSSSKVALYSLGTVASYPCCQQGQSLMHTRTEKERWRQRVQSHSSRGFASRKHGVPLTDCDGAVLVQSGFLSRLQELGHSRDRTVAKYAARVSQRMNLST